MDLLLEASAKEKKKRAMTRESSRRGSKCTAAKVANAPTHHGNDARVATHPLHTEQRKLQTQTLRPNPSTDSDCCPLPNGGLSAYLGRVFENLERVRPNGVTATTHTLRQRPLLMMIVVPSLMVA